MLLAAGQPGTPRVDSWGKFSGQVCILNRDADKYGDYRMTEGHSRGRKGLQVMAAARGAVLRM